MSHPPQRPTVQRLLARYFVGTPDDVCHSKIVSSSSYKRLKTHIRSGFVAARQMYCATGFEICTEAGVVLYAGKGSYEAFSQITEASLRDWAQIAIQQATIEPTNKIRCEHLPASEHPKISD